MARNYNNRKDTGIVRLGMFPIYEAMHFFFEEQGKKEYKKKIETVKKDLGNWLQPALTSVLRDITILLGGDETAPGYKSAFQRYVNFYQNFSMEGLRGYYGYLINTFDLEVPHIKTELKRIPEFKQKPDMEKILSGDYFHGKKDDDFPDDEFPVFMGDEEDTYPDEDYVPFDDDEDVPF